MPRKYQKRSPYWTNAQSPEPVIEQLEMKFPAAMTDDPHFTAVAACGGGDVETTVMRDGSSPTLRETNRFRNINSGLVPFDSWGDNVGCRSAIEAVYKAYFNVAILRNAINMMVDFSVSKIHVKTSNKTVRNAVQAWFEAIGLWAFQSQFFMEYHRSSNAFIYSYSGKIPDDRFGKLQEVFSAKSPTIPIRYIMLNPMQVALQIGAGYPNVWAKMLSTFEIARLKNPKTAEDRQVYNSLPDEVKKQIQTGAGWPYLFMPLDAKRLYYVFNKKQDYEPMAIPAAYPVLNDIEFKLELKRIDYTLARMMEQAHLRVTTGMPRDQWNKGLNPENLQNLQNIFRSQSVGRVLVGDWTTKSEWVIPDLKTLLGVEKYARVDQDIREGLQYMFFGDEKFANASIKVKIFIESLKEGRRAFMNNFLIPEVQKFCQAMNFKNVPTLEMEEINLQDEALMNKLYVQMAQLGLLTPDETVTSLKTGVLPDKDSSFINQTEYKQARDKGLYFPLVGGMDPNAGAGGAGRPPGASGPKTSVKVSPIGTKARFGGKQIVEALYKLQSVKDDVIKTIKREAKLKALNETQDLAATSVAKAIFLNESENDWKTSIVAYLADPKPISTEVTAALDDIMIEFDMDEWGATVLYKSQVEHKDA